MADASKFLAQSQSRLVGQATDPNDPNPPRNPRLGSRYLQRQGMPSPYQQSGSQLARFPFSARAVQQQAPLFYSATDEFREEDDGEEHEREVADYYALQRSRRHFGASNISESSEVDETAENSKEDEVDSKEDDQPYGLGRGIRSSWKGDNPVKRGRPPAVGESVIEQPERERSRQESARNSSKESKGKGKLVDVELTQSESSSVDALDREEVDDAPPPFQQFRNPPNSRPQFEHTWLPQETDEETARLQPRPPSPDRESVPAGVTGEAQQVPRYDVFWGTAYWISMAGMFGSAFLVWLHTDTPGKNPLGDTIYTTLSKSYHLLAVDTLVSVIVAALWLALLRSFLRHMTYLIIVAVPIILFSFSLYPLISSFNGSWHGGSFQDRMMRLWSLLPSAGAFMWIYLFIKARHSVEKGLEILAFGCKILTESPALVLVGFGTLAANIVWFWVWLFMFTRVFLEGHWTIGSSKNLFVPDASSWWLGAFYFLMLMWTQSVISGVQRATSGATVSQWYFHRLTNPAPSSRTVVAASFTHATGTLFGTICLSTFLAVMIRLPLLLLPRRFVGWFSLCFYSIVPSPIAALTNPLTLTYAAIHSQPLSTAARGLSSLSFVSATSATTTLTPNTFSNRSNTRTDNLVPYRTAKLILHGTRYMMVLALGYGAWVATSRLLQIDGETYRGSLYAYVVGLGAAAIGWSVLGATEGIILGIVDAVVVCWGSEVGALRGQGRNAARYCREAGELFGEGRRGYGEV